MVKAATCTVEGTTAYTASCTYGGVEYTDTKTVTTSATGHSYACSNYVTLGDTGSATIAAVRCDDCGEYEIVELTSLQFTAYNANGNAVAVASSVNTSGNTASLASARLTSGSVDTVAYYVVSRGTYTGADIIIPATYNGKPVYYVDDFSDSNYSGDVSVSIGTQTITLTYSTLNSITIPNGVLEIKASAFANCDSLTTITVPDTVTTIGANAFSGCSGLTSITLPFAGHNADGSYLDSSELTFAYIFGTIPTGLATVEITGGGTENNTRITATAFANCTTITSMVVGDYITEIAAGAFSGCSNLTSITLPFVGGSAAANTAGFTTMFGYIFGASPYGSSTATRQYYTTSSANSTTYYIPDSLTTVTITGAGNSVIWDGSFSFCTKIKNVIFGDDVTGINYMAFWGCSGLSGVTLGSSLTSIGSYVFYNCKAITAISIPSSVKTVGSNAFMNCSKLKKVYITDLSAWCDIDFATASSYYYTGTNPLYYNGDLYLNGVQITELVIPNNVTTLKACAFIGGTFTSVTIPDSVTSIGMYAFCNCLKLSTVSMGSEVNEICWGAFYECSTLENINIPSNVTSIGYAAFYSCTSLESITIPSSVKSLGSSCFQGCSSLTTITLNEGLTTISDYSFFECSKLETITVDSNNAYYKATDNVLYSKDGKQLILYAAAKTDTMFTVDDAVEVIGIGAFSCCTNLTSITIGSSVKTIGYKTFDGCTSLTTVTLGSGVTSIGDNAFYGCCSLATITVDDSNSYYKATDNVLYSKDGKQLILYAAAKIDTAFTVDNTVEVICDGAFNNCTNLTSITIGSSVKTIGYQTFYNCTSLATVTFSDTSGWYYTSSSDYTGGKSITVTTPADNVTYLTSTYVSYYWYKN